MKKGKFLVRNVSELDIMYEDINSINKISDLLYLNLTEREKETHPIKTFIEYFDMDYRFYSTGVNSKANEEMFIYAKKEFINKITRGKFYNEIVKKNVEREKTIKKYIDSFPDECLYDFWWNIDENYFIVFGKEKIELINNFIRMQYKKDNFQMIKKR
jgi:hypothetical protein